MPKFNQFVIIGFGGVAKAFSMILLNSYNSFKKLPLIIFDQLDINESDTYKKLCKIMKVKFIQIKITKENYKQIFNKYIPKHSIVIDLAYRIGTMDIINQCRKHECLYINTSIDDWQPIKKTLIESKQEIINNLDQNDKPMTSVINHGMNPGIISHLVKYFLKKLTKISKNKIAVEYYKQKKYNYVANELGVNLIQIVERDNQISFVNSNEKFFINTWSVIGLIDEATSNVEISWGTHEKKLPAKCKITNNGQIVMPLLGYQLRTKSFEPTNGYLTGYCIPHAECYSIADYLQIKSANNIIYRPSVYYSYLVPDSAKILFHFIDYCIFDNHLPEKNHVLRSDEIIDGYDSVGCLFYLRNGKRYWIGSVLNNDFAIKISPEINATCIQVASGVISAILWMLKNPYMGLLEPEELDTTFILSVAKEWLGDLYYKDVTELCGLKSDQFSDLLIYPNNVVFKN